LTTLFCSSSFSIAWVCWRIMVLYFSFIGHSQSSSKVFAVYHQQANLSFSSCVPMENMKLSRESVMVQSQITAVDNNQ
jgi:hypothetical protein